MDCFSVAVAITIPIDGATVDRSAGITTAHLAQASDVGSDTLVLAVLATIVVATGSLALWRRAGDDGPSTQETSSSDRPDLSEEGAREDSRDDRTVVRDILQSHGGRTRQSVIVDETGWSKAKVSAVLAEMHEDDAVSKLRVGRENIVSLPGHEPDAVGSPIED